MTDTTAIFAMLTAVWGGVTICALGHWIVAVRQTLSAPRESRDESEYVDEFEDELGRVRWQPSYRKNGAYVDYIVKTWQAHYIADGLYKPVLYRSKRRAARVARRFVQRNAQFRRTQ